jgi:hypothetical protein
MQCYKCLTCDKECVVSHQKTNKYCSQTCQLAYQHNQYIAEWKQGLQTGKCGKLQTSRYIKRYMLEKQQGKCASCGLTDWMGKILTLDLDHINGNSQDNSESNLRCICPNCHSQTPTYKAKNKGNGRKER